MKTYWDSSALIEALHDQGLRANLTANGHGSRIHSLTEVFSTLTKGVNYRYSPGDAAKMISDLTRDLDLVELTKEETLSAIKAAESLGVRGARIHDLMHATAARKYQAGLLMTLDQAGFQGIGSGMKVENP